MHLYVIVLRLQRGEITLPKCKNYARWTTELSLNSSKVTQYLIAIKIQY